MGSISIPSSQDEVIDTAAATAPTSKMSIARSMARYKGNRRYARSHEPPLPAIGIAGAVQRSPPPEQAYGPSPAEVLPKQDNSQDFIQGSPVQDPQCARSAPPRTSRPRRASRRQDREELAPAEGLVEPEPTKYAGHRTQMLTEDEHRRAGTSQHLRVATEKGGDEMNLRRVKTRRHTGSMNGRPDLRPSQAFQGRGVNAEEVASPKARAVKDTITNEKPGSFSPRMAAQPPRPQAFRNGSSREELKRMISGPIPTVAQETAVAPPRKQPEPPIDASRSHTSQELSLTPRFDAPISAVNAGQRVVRVKYEGSDIFLPITPSTTPVDVIHAAARQLSAPIDQNSTVLLESFKQVGLERPLRKYEHIRDVLNSWDNDAQNTLIVIPSPSGGKDDDLDVENVSKAQPGETTVHLYHSQKPGNWNKRWITLRSDGQVVVAKKRGGETTNICHLSDFDIYIPTPRYASKKIKPPKKVCFAVKSQQKSSMFMTTENFVHFFCTNDRSLGTSWYTAVQQWRSWYLVNVMGEGQKSACEANARIGMQQSLLRNRGPVLQHQHQASVERNPRPHVSTPATSTLPVRSRTITSTTPTYPKKLTKDPLTNVPTTHHSGPQIYQTLTTPPAPTEPFDPASLLGRTYTQKQKAQQRPQAPSTDIPPPIPTTINVNRNDSPHRTDAPVNGLNRHSSQRHQPKPLIDLTPVYQEPPQHSRKGRGVIPAQIPMGGLVEVATSPENPIDAPSATTWRKGNV